MRLNKMNKNTKQKNTRLTGKKYKQLLKDNNNSIAFQFLFFEDRVDKFKEQMMYIIDSKYSRTKKIIMVEENLKNLVKFIPNYNDIRERLCLDSKSQKSLTAEAEEYQLRRIGHSKYGESGRRVQKIFDKIFTI